jgi:translation initiation factor IF-2
MGKIRVYQLAKKLHLENKELLEIVGKLGIEIKSHMSVVDDEAAKTITASVKASSSGSSPAKPGAKAARKKASPANLKKAAKKDTTKKASEKEPAKERPAKKKPLKKEATKKKTTPKEPEKKKPAKKETAAKKSPKKEPAVKETTKKKTAPKEPEKKKPAKKETTAKKSPKKEPAVKETTRDAVTPAAASAKAEKATKALEKAPAPPEKEPATQAAPRVVQISEGITVKDLAERLDVKVSEIIKRFIKRRKMVVVNQFLDFETAKSMAEELGCSIQPVSLEEEGQAEAVQEDFSPRAPIVTIMGHVDHGKTSLLDAIRESSLTDKEKGGITQHIGAYHVELPTGTIVFLDTPGHEAFTAMRARGAEVTDIVILVVAADDGVMPQTREAVDHAKAAGVPIIVAVNKIDKPDSKPDTVKTQLSELDLIPEDWGGQTIYCDVSAKQKIGLDNLLEMILLQAEVMELKANPNKPCRGTVIESKIDRGRGPVATVLVQDGSLKVGDYFVTGTNYGKARAIISERGDSLAEALPSTPVEVLGLSGVPLPGDRFQVVPDERKARQIVSLRQEKSGQPVYTRPGKVNLQDLFSRISQGGVKELSLIVKGDVQGSVEAISDALEKLTTETVKVKVIHRGVGTVNESDILLASAAGAVIIGFNVRPEPKVSDLAGREGVDMRFYTIIYKATEDIKKAMLGLLEPTYREESQGRAEVRETFSVPRVGIIAGCGVLDGKVIRSSEARIVRDGAVVYEGRISSLRRFKDDAKEVTAGYECGIGVENFNDIKKGDIIETFIQVEVAPVL